MRTPRSEFGGSLPFVVAFTPRVHLLQSIPSPNFRQSLEEGRQDHQMIHQHSSLDEWARCLALWFALLALPISFPVRAKRSCWHVCLGLQAGQREAQDCLLPITQKHNAFCYQGAPQFFLVFYFIQFAYQNSLFVYLLANSNPGVFEPL